MHADMQQNIALQCLQSTGTLDVHFRMCCNFGTKYGLSVAEMQMGCSCGSAALWGRGILAYFDLSILCSMFIVWKASKNHIKLICLKWFIAVNLKCVLKEN